MERLLYWIALLVMALFVFVLVFVLFGLYRLN